MVVDPGLKGPLHLFPAEPSAGDRSPSPPCAVEREFGPEDCSTASTVVEMGAPHLLLPDMRCARSSPIQSAPLP